MVGGTTELMNGADMRLLVEPGADPVEIVALLHQAAEWIMRTPEILDGSRWEGTKPYLIEPREDDDPERIKRRLQGFLDFLDNLGHGAPGTSPLETSPLAKVIAGKIREAIDSGDVEQMVTAAKMADEARPALDRDSERPV